MKIVFATNNKHKLDEIRDILGPSFEVLSLNDLGCHDDIPETGRKAVSVRLSDKGIFQGRLRNAPQGQGL